MFCSQVYLGGFDSEQQAALAYDVAAIKCRGEEASTNFDMNDYAQELAALDAVNKEELVLSLRRQSKGFVKGSSKFRGVTRHQKGRWEARIGQLVGRKYRYLGLYDREEEAAVAYDTEAVRQKGFDAVTNFDLSEYADVLAEVSLFLFPYFYFISVWAVRLLTSCFFCHSTTRLDGLGVLYPTPRPSPRTLPPRPRYPRRPSSRGSRLRASPAAGVCSKGRRRRGSRGARRLTPSEPSSGTARAAGPSWRSIPSVRWRRARETRRRRSSRRGRRGVWRGERFGRPWIRLRRDR